MSRRIGLPGEEVRGDDQLDDQQVRSRRSGQRQQARREDPFDPGAVIRPASVGDRANGGEAILLGEQVENAVAVAS